MLARNLKWMAWLWIFTLLTATVGVSVQKIYCYCVGKTTVSLFAVEDQCEKRKAPVESACCHKPAPQHSCCTEKQKQQHSDTNGCTKKSSRFFQLKTEFTLEQKSFDNLLPLPVDQEFTAAPSPVTCALPDAPDAGRAHVYAHPPPPPSGRMICVRHGVFRC